MSDPTFSVVVPAFVPKSDKGGTVLAGLLRCVRAVIATMPSPQFVEVLVQDDASPGLTEWDGVLPGLVRYERNPTNLGFAGNCNAGAARARGRYLLFLNQDAYPFPGWYEGLIEGVNAAQLAGRPAGILGPKLLFPPPMDEPITALRLQSAGGWYDAACHPFHRWLGFLESYPEANVCEEVSWITGAVHVWTREAFAKAGGYDTGYEGGYFEDVDACCRVQQAGYRVWYAPAARFLHATSTSGGVKPEQFRANAVRFYRTWVATRRVSKDVDVIQPESNWW